MAVEPHSWGHRIDVLIPLSPIIVGPIFRVLKTVSVSVRSQFDAWHCPHCDATSEINEVAKRSFRRHVYLSAVWVLEGGPSGR